MLQEGTPGRAKPGWRAWFAPAPDSLMAATLRPGRPRWVEWVTLVWSAWVFITPLFTPAGHSLRWLLLTLASYPLFLWLYAMALRRPQRVAPRHALAMVALGMMLLPWYPSGMSYFI